MDYQQLSDDIFNRFELGKITRRQFYNEYNELYGFIPEKQRSNLKRRMDFSRGQKGRCLGQFALDIYDTTKRETMLVKAWLQLVMDTGRLKDVSLTSSGVDNSGRLLIDSRDGKPDYTITYTGIATHRSRTRGLEIKFTGQLKKLTYKVRDFESYIKSDALVLTIVSDGMVGPNGDPDSNVPLALDTSKLRWFTLHAAQMKKMLETIPIRDYRELGGKPAIQIMESDFYKHLSIKHWS